jgi:hypothetical protein
MIRLSWFCRLAKLFWYSIAAAIYFAPANGDVGIETSLTANQRTDK